MSSAVAAVILAHLSRRKLPDVACDFPDLARKCFAILLGVILFVCLVSMTT